MDSSARLQNKLTKKSIAGGISVTTPRAEGIKLRIPEEYLHSLHVPYHTNILSQKSLTKLGLEEGLQTSYLQETTYMDSWKTGTSWSFIETLLMLGGNEIDSRFEPPKVMLFLKNPSLVFKLILGYLYPKIRQHMTMVFGGQI